MEKPRTPGVPRWLIKIIGVFVLIAIVLILTLAWYFDLFNLQENMTPQAQNERIIQDLITNAAQYNDISFCEKILDPNCKELCELSVLEPTPGACSMLASFSLERDSPCKRSQKNNLLWNCYTELYEETKDEQWCVKLEEHGGPGASDCFSKAGYSGTELCKKFVTNYGDLWNCFKNGLSQDVEITADDCRHYESVSERDGSSCYRDLARITQNESYCKYATWLFDEEDCFVEVAVARNDSSICDKIRADCYTGSGMTSCGSKHESQISYRDYCRQKVAYCTMNSKGIMKCI